MISNLWLGLEGFRPLSNGTAGGPTSQWSIFKNDPKIENRLFALINLSARVTILRLITPRKKSRSLCRGYCLRWK